MRHPLDTTAGTKERSAVRRRLRTAFNVIGVVVLLLGLICATVVYWGAQDRATQQASNPQTYNADSGWTDDTLSPEDTKGSSRGLELNFGKVGALIISGWHQLEGLPLFGSPAATIVTASLLIALSCFFAAHRSRGP
jgi:hypothetical protein